MEGEISLGLLMGFEKILNVRELVGPFMKLLVERVKKLSMWHDNWPVEGVLIPNFVQKVVYDTAISEFAKVSSILKEMQ